MTTKKCAFCHNSSYMFNGSLYISSCGPCVCETSKARPRDCEWTVERRQDSELRHIEIQSSLTVTRNIQFIHRDKRQISRPSYGRRWCLLANRQSTWGPVVETLRRPETCSAQNISPQRIRHNIATGQ